MMNVAPKNTDFPANLIDGKAVAAREREALKEEVAEMTSQGLTPGLAVILVGDDPASQVYVQSKIKTCEEIGIRSFERRLPADTQAQDLLAVIDELNKNKDVHGILLQLPLPEQLDANEMILAIDPVKDVDGLHPENAGRLMAGMEGYVPCTPQGSMILIKEVEQNLSGLHAVVIGRSLLFGKPMGQLLLQENCTVTQTHSRTKDLPGVCKQADILVAAVGQPEMVKADWVKDGAIVIDVGINRLPHPDKPGKTKLYGDVETDAVRPHVRAITPVPGGVGPMTILCLLKNTVKAAKRQSA